MWRGSLWIGTTFWRVGAGARLLGRLQAMSPGYAGDQAPAAAMRHPDPAVVYYHAATRRPGTKRIQEDIEL
jgi:hypothetical protein